MKEITDNIAKTISALMVSVSNFNEQIEEIETEFFQPEDMDDSDHPVIKALSELLIVRKSIEELLNQLIANDIEHKILQNSLTLKAVSEAIIKPTPLAIYVKKKKLI